MQKKVYATCVKRPFWFMVDGMRRKVDGEYKVVQGFRKRAEHLPDVRKSPGIEEAKRRLILTPDDIAGIFLTAWIDLNYKGTIATRSKDLCGKGDIPEISWFHKQVNSARGVELEYVFKGGKGKFLDELGDRVMVTEGQNRYFVTYSFETGNLEMGLNVNQEHLDWFESGHTDEVCKSFSMLLSQLSGEQWQEIAEKAVSLCNDLHNELNHPDYDYINIIEGLPAEQRDFLRDVRSSLGCSELKELKNEWLCKKFSNLANIYKDLVRRFKDDGCLPFAVILDEGYLDLLVQVASWCHNARELEI